jgi:hypothetical protein
VIESTPIVAIVGLQLPAPILAGRTASGIGLAVKTAVSPVPVGFKLELIAMAAPAVGPVGTLIQVTFWPLAKQDPPNVEVPTPS